MQLVSEAKIGHQIPYSLNWNLKFEFALRQSIFWFLQNHPEVGQKDSELRIAQNISRIPAIDDHSAIR